MKKQIRKITSLFVITALMCQLFSISIFSSGNNNAIGQLNYIIENPYKNVDWDTWGAYKGATHVHSHLSDGSENFHEMVEAYYSAGYDCLSMTDHGTVNYGWTAEKSRHTIFFYQFFVHGEVRPLSEQRNQEITTGVGRDGRGMIDVPLGIELNGASTKKVHVNSYFADCGDGDMELGSTWPESAVVKCQNAGGLCHINHVGEWSGGNDNVNIYDDVFVNDFSNLFLNYSSCIGMELVNTSDNRTRNDRVLYDKTLQITAPQGKNVFGFCEDDAHEFGDIGRNAQIFMMPSNTASNVRTCMETGAFFACSKNAKTPAELGDGFSATGDYPSVTEVEVDEYSDQISFECNNATKMTMVANGEILDTVSISAGTDIVTFDLNEYEDRIGSYVRFYLTGPGGICYVQPFLLTAEQYVSSTAEFVLPSLNTTLVVKDSNGTVIEPLNDEYLYDLDAGNYTYTAERKGYLSKVDEPFTISVSDIENGIKKVITVTLEEDPNSLFTYFYVPETIYLEPSTGNMNTFKYYVDCENAANGSLTGNAADTEGNIFFYCPEATQVTISVDPAVSAVAANGSIDFRAGYTVNDSTVSTKITSGALATSIPANSGSVLKWTATYKLTDGNTYNAYAYSYVYAPQSGEVAAAVRQVHTYSSDIYNQGILWLIGFNSVTGGSSNCTKNFFFDTAPTSDTGVANWFQTLNGGGSTFVDQSHSSNASDTETANGGTGVLAVDSSRYTNLNQIPYLKLGYWQCDCEGEDSGIATGWIKQNADSGEVLLKTINNRVGLVYLEAIDYSNDARINGLKKIDFHAYSLTGRGSRDNHNYYNIDLSVTYIDKSDLRETVNSCIKNSYQPQWFTAASFDNYLSKYEQACIALGKPNASESEVSTANSQLAAAIGSLVCAGSGTAIINYYEGSAGGALLSSKTLSYDLGSRVTVYAEDIEGYTLENWALYGDSVLMNAGTDYQSAVLNAMHTSYEWNFIYSPNNYSVTFNSNGAGDFTPEGGTGATATYNSSYMLPINILTKEGYTFAGWRLDQNNTIYPAGGSLIWDIDSNATFTAQWSAKTYVVILDPNAGTLSAPSEFTVEYDSSFDFPPNPPERPGYVFIGWLLSNNGEIYGITSTITWVYASGGTFTAQWEPNTYNVEYVDGLGGSNSYTENAVFDEEFPLCSYVQAGFTRPGYKQIGWSLNGEQYEENDLVKNLTNINGETITFEAVWVLDSYIVSFDANGGDCLTDEKTVTNGETYGSLPIPMRTGYTFGGWFVIRYDDNCVTDPSGCITEDMVVDLSADQTLYAYWAVSTYSLIINYNDGSPSLTVTQDYGTSYYVPTPERTGYSFTGWAFSGDGTWNSTDGFYTFNGTDDAADTLTADWSVNSYSIRINPNGGIWEGSQGISTVTREYGQTITVGQPSRLGFSFNGWVLDGDGNWSEADSIYTFSGVDSATDTLEAQWLINTYNLYVNPNGGSINGSSADFTVSQEYGTSYTVPVPVRTGYTFDGWEFSGDGTWNSTDGVYNFSGIDETDDSLTARWSANTYSLIIDPSGGTINGSAQSLTVTQGYGSSFAVPIPSRPGYSFLGWEFSGDGSWNEYEDVYTFIGTDNQHDTLTADWSVKKFGLIIDPSGGTWNGNSGISTIIKQYCTAIQIEEPQRTGYTFTGWVLTGDGEWSSESKTYIFSGTDSQIDVLKASWEFSSYRLTVNPNEGSWNGTSEITTITMSYGTQFSVVAPERTGYTFTGWEFSGDGGWNSETNTYTFNGTDDIADTLTAVWTKATYIIATEENILIDSDSKVISGLSVGLKSLENLLLPAADDCTLDIRSTANGCGTGTVVNVIKNDEIIESYVVVIYGDLDGNSKTDGCDALTAMLIAGGMLSSENVSQAVLMAADANHDGVVNELDAQLLVLAGLFLAEISQTV